MRKKFKKLKNKCRGLHVKNILRQNTDEFCRNTALHGLKYVRDPDLKPSERFFFAISFITVVCLAIYLIVRVYDKWATTPVIVSIDPELNFVTDQPFPAVTICNLNQALHPKVKDFARNSPEYAMLQLLCKRNVNSTVVKRITHWDNLDKFIVNISQSCREMIVDCRFGGKDYECEHMFKTLVTDQGLCCVFNMLHPKFMYVSFIPPTFKKIENDNYPEPVNWFAEKGYQENLPKKFSPSKVPGVGESLGLSVTLNVQRDKYYCSSSNSIGFKLAVHSPNESPNVRETGVLIENGKETKLRIRPEKMEADQHLRSIERKVRNCLFENEGNLKFFAHYTQRNCEMECVAEVSHNHCGCVSFFMPKIFNNMSVCSISDLNCERTVLLRTDNNIKSCLDDCLPSCHDLNFEVDAFSSKISHEGFDIANPNIEHLSQSYVEDNIAVVHLYFKDNSFRSNKQSEYIGIADFLSSIGGIMGLFLGFSFVSIAELIYFAILRPYRSICKYHTSENIYEDMENGSSKKLSKSVQVPEGRKALEYAKIQNNQDRFFGHKVPLPYLLNGDMEKPEKNGVYAWLE